MKSTVWFAELMNQVAEWSSNGAFWQSYLIYWLQFNEWETSSWSISPLNSLYFILKEKSFSEWDRTSIWLGKLCSTIVLVESSKLWNSQRTCAGGNRPLPSMSIRYTSGFVYPREKFQCTRIVLRQMISTLISSSN